MGKTAAARKAAAFCKPFGFREHIAELKDHFVVAIHDGGAAP
jgi:hypothetical protein